MGLTRHAGGWQLADGRFECPDCHARTSVTAGTIFDRTRTPLTVWFNACWLFASGKDGIAALSLKRTLEIGSVQTAWMILHRLRSVLVRPGRERLTGVVEVDETFIGGEEPGLRGGRARGKKVLTGIAVEIRPAPKGIGRCRMAPLADASAHCAVQLPLRGGIVGLCYGRMGEPDVDHCGLGRSAGSPPARGDRMSDESRGGRPSPDRPRRGGHHRRCARPRRCSALGCHRLPGGIRRGGGSAVPWGYRRLPCRWGHRAGIPRRASALANSR